jgi:hypothetical protein
MTPGRRRSSAGWSIPLSEMCGFDATYEIARRDASLPIPRGEMSIGIGRLASPQHLPDLPTGGDAELATVLAADAISTRSGYRVPIAVVPDAW